MRDGSSSDGSVTREFCKAATLAALALLAAGASASAQSLQRVSVTSFALSADALHPRVGAPFHVIVTLRLAQRVPDVENLQLPLLAGLDVLGDVRGTTVSSRGTLYKELITVAALRAGTIVLSPATFDAIDARDGKAKEYSTNSLAIEVARAPGSSPVAAIAARLLVSVGVAMIVLGIVLLLSMRRRQALVPSAPKAVPVPAAAPQYLRDALALLERKPTREGALQARSLVWRMVGASDGETLADVMKCARESHPTLLGVLAALERAAFTYDDDVEAGVQKALAALREMQ